MGERGEQRQGGIKVTGIEGRERRAEKGGLRKVGRDRREGHRGDGGK